MRYFIRLLALPVLFALVDESRFGLATASPICQELFSSSELTLPAELEKSPQEAIWFLSENGHTGEAMKMEQELAEKLKNGEIQSIKEFDRANSKAYLITFPSGETALFKPKQKRNNWIAEVLAYEVDKLFGLNMVPITVGRKIKLHWYSSPVEGSLQYFIGHADSRVPIRLLNSARFSSLMTALDYLIDNNDRSHNFLNVSDRVVLIDGGDGFSQNNRTYPNAAVIDLVEKMPEPYRSRFLTTGPDEFKSVLSPLQDPGAIENAAQRFIYLQDALRQSNLKGKAKLESKRKIASPTNPASRVKKRYPIPRQGLKTGTPKHHLHPIRPAPTRR